MLRLHRQNSWGAPFYRSSAFRALMVVAMAAASVLAGCESDDDRAPGVDGRVAGSSVAAPSAVSGHTQASSTGCVAGKVDAALTTMSRQQKLAQLLMVGVTGQTDAEKAARAYGVGGIFIGSWTDTSILNKGRIDAIQAASKVPMMVSIDEEGGRVSRLRGIGINDPSARTIAKTLSVQQAENIAYNRGQILRRLGITIDFSPDIDVSNEPDDAVIGDRSFSNSAPVVIRYARATIKGLKRAGITPVVKHFPGHGHGTGDSHAGSVSTPSLSQLKKVDLVPFQQLVGPGLGVMVGHLTVPGLTHGKPASLSKPAYSLLRHGIGYGARPFDGPIFTDDLSGMKAIAGEYGIASAATLAIEAGATVALWLSTDDVPEVLRALSVAMDKGRLSVSTVDAAVRRNLVEKYAMNC